MAREGDKWRMRFAGAEGCEALVHEEEDELRLPGRLPPQCARLCPNRASLSGLRLPRASWSADDARDLRIRSEEHTSELQSLMRISYAVFCLKKKRRRIDTK